METHTSQSTTHKIPERKNFFEASYSKLSKMIAPYFINTPLTPNHVTVISGLFGVAGAFLLMVDSYLSLFLAGVFIQIFAILDLVDGDMARAKKMQSNFGMWLDIFFDKLTDFLLIIGFATGAYFQTDDPIMLFLGMTLMGINFSIQFIMVLNDHLFKTMRASNEKIINSVDTEERKSGFLPLIQVMMFFRNHLSLQHNTFLFLISVFAILDQLVLGLVFMTIHGVISLGVSVAVNFYKIR